MFQAVKPTMILIACVLAASSLSACGRSTDTAAAASEPTRVPSTQTPYVIEVTKVVTAVVTSVVTAAPQEAATATPTPQEAATVTPQISAEVEATSVPTTAATATPEPTPEVVVPTASPVAANAGQIVNGGNLRESPGGAVLGQVCPGDSVSFAQALNEWYQIKIEQTAPDCVPDRAKVGTLGWLHSSLVSAPTTAVPTTTPAPTPTPAPTAEVSELNQTLQLGPIRDSLREESFSVEMTLQQIRWATAGDYSEPKKGKIFVIASLRVKNLGPSPMRSIGARSFQVLDANGALDDYTLIGGITDDCQFDSVDLISGGTAEGCVAFEVPIEGPVQLIYAPYQYEGLKSGRYLSFMLRP